MDMEFGVLGPLEIIGASGTVNLKGLKLPALLGVLLLNAGIAVPIPRLVRALWDSEPPASATANLRTYVHSLRAGLGEVTQGAHERLVSLPRGYRLDVERPELDLLRFERHADDGDVALRQGDLVRAEAEFAAAIKLWRGPALDGLDLRSWVRAKITSLEDQHWAVMSSWIDTRLALGLHDEAVAHLRQMVAERPLSERAWTQLAAALYGTGQTGAALATFSTARRTLIEQLGMEPGPQLCLLQEGILAGDSELVAQATNAPTGSPARITASAPPTGGCFLPAEVRNFVASDGGRVVAEAVRVLMPDQAAGAPPVLVLCGPPGSGTSTTAIHVAHRLREHYPDGQLYCAAEGRPVDRVVSDLLVELGVARRDVPGDFAERVVLYRALVADRRILVVVDKVNDPADLHSLVPGPGTAAFLATSPHRLCGLSLGHVMHLGRMSAQDAVDLLASFAGRCRIEAEPDALAQVVEICDGLPLALAIVGVRLNIRPLWPVAALAARLADSPGLDEFEIGSVSLRRVLQDAFGRQRPEVRRAFQVLSRRPEPTFTALTIARLLDVSETRADRLAEAMVRVSMVEALDALEGRQQIYRIPRLFQLYGRETAAPGPDDSEKVPPPGLQRSLQNLAERRRPGNLVVRIEQPEK
jgi:DNA-binding SARP family transcriptional activator/DNA polymerase III delta prime subunit